MCSFVHSVLLLTPWCTLAPACFIYLFHYSPSAERPREWISVRSAGEGHFVCTGLTMGCFRDKTRAGKRRNQGILGKNKWENRSISWQMSQLCASRGWSVHLHGHALCLTITVCASFSLNPISSYFPDWGCLSCVQKCVCGAQWQPWGWAQESE